MRLNGYVDELNWHTHTHTHTHTHVRIETAEAIYNQCNDLEYENTSNVIDLRYVQKQDETFRVVVESYFCDCNKSEL